ncbi:UNVERIFIED_CONTAM: ParB/RepB/Spo0J family partition protein [Paenibacillus sp. PvR008]
MAIDIPMSNIQPNPNQPRKQFDEESLRELADSIVADGLQSPILVRRVGEGYEIVQGERRYRAHVLAGLSSIRAEIRDLSDTEAFHLAVIENIQREQLTDIEEAHAFQNYVELGYTHEQVAEKVKKSRTYVTSKLRLLKLILKYRIRSQRETYPVGTLSKSLKRRP